MQRSHVLCNLGKSSDTKMGQKRKIPIKHVKCNTFTGTVNYQQTFLCVSPRFILFFYLSWCQIFAAFCISDYIFSQPLTLKDQKKISGIFSLKAVLKALCRNAHYYCLHTKREKWVSFFYFAEDEVRRLYYLFEMETWSRPSDAFWNHKSKLIHGTDQNIIEEAINEKNGNPNSLTYLNVIICEDQIKKKRSKPCNKNDQSK